MNPLPRNFYDRGAEAVARDLLGATLCRQQEDHVARVRIVETEAYVGEHDLACHAAKGRTPRTEVLFGPPGRAYVYFVYGMHHMLNAVCASEGDAQAVLVRAAEPLGEPLPRLDGPGRLTKALDITVQQHDRRPLDERPVWIEAGEPPGRVAVGPRVGVDYAGDWAAAPLRFWDVDSPSASRPRQAVAAPGTRPLPHG